MGSKTVIFFGAGTTKYCGVPLTNDQTDMFQAYFFEDDNAFKKYLKEKMSVLKDEDAETLLKLKEDAKIQQLIEFVKVMFLKEGFVMMSFYDLIDMAVSERRGFFAPNNKEYTVEQLKQFRNSILVVLQTVFALLEKNILKNKTDDFNKLKKFFKDIAKAELDKRIEHIISVDMQSKDFIFTDVEYLSTNWDVLILWAMMLAHKELNNENSRYLSDKQGIYKLKVFNDFFAYLNSKDINDSDDKDWFPYNQTVAYRLNDTDHISDKRVILFPTYFPHGQTHWLECPVCGKMTMYIDSKFKTYTHGFEMRCDQEYKCSHCNKKLSLENSAMLLQTNYKIKSPSLEQIQRSMRVALNNCDRIIFIGYSLPSDDVEYNSLLRISNANKKEAYVVLYVDNGENRFVSADEASKKCDKDTEEIIKRFTNIFGKENVKVNLAGFPNVASEVIELLRE